MRLVAVSRVLNEEDVIEPMVRHHAALVDHHVILDNGSVDRTLEILTALGAEGLNLTVLQNNSVLFSEEQFNTSLYEFAVRERAADWVLFLDADEFVDARRVGDLRALLGSVPPQYPSLGVQMINYDAPTEVSLREINVVRRFVRRVPAPIGVWKVFVRAPEAGQTITINAGNHSIDLDGAFVDPPRQDAFLLAHFPNRGPLHWAGKAVTGWLKVLAAGEMDKHEGRSGHYESTFAFLTKDPEGWVNWSRQGGVVPPESGALVEDPIAYLGAPLLHTERVDYGWRSLRLLLANTERLAIAHGRLLEENVDLRRRVEGELRDMRLIVGRGGAATAKAAYGAIVTAVWRHSGDPGFAALLGNGWGEHEAWGGVWGLGGAHELKMVLPSAPKDGVFIEMFVQVPLIGSRVEQRVDVLAGDEILESWHFDREHNGAIRRIFVPFLLADENAPIARLVFKPQLVTIPAELNPESNDRRALGLGLVRLRCFGA